MHNLLITHALVVLVGADPSPHSGILIEADPSPSAVATASGPTGTSPQNVRPSDRLGQEDLLGKLEVQNAIRAARQSMESGRFAEAASRLESCVDRAGGSSDFLSALEAAYRAQLTDLIGRGQSKDASLVARKLRSLGVDPSNIGPPTATVPPPNPAEVAAEVITKPIVVDAANRAQRATVADKVQDKAASMVAPVKRLGQSMAESVRSLIPKAEKPNKPADATIQVRGKMEEGVSLSPTGHESVEQAVPPCLRQASELFGEKRYTEALSAYEKAYQADPVAVQAQRARWGYCLLYVTIDRYNALIDQDASCVDPSTWQDLKADAETAKRLAPSIEYTDKVVAAITDRIRESATRPRTSPAVATHVSPAAAPPMQAYATAQPRPVANIGFQHRASSDGQWQAAETRNFIIYHRDARLAEMVGTEAEQARQYALDLWFAGETTTDWQPKCEIYLYPTAQEYGMSTGVGPQSPGHSKVGNSGGTIVSRKVFLRTDDPNMSQAVLPHEVAHVVFAGRFGAHTLPRWADEGMAVLTEPVDKQNAHLANLARCQSSGRGFSCAEVMTMGQYPGGEAMRDFYAHSVGICRYLVERHGHAKLVSFLRTALDSGNYEAALAQVYGMSSFSQIEANFRGYIASIGGGAVAMAR